MKTVCHSLMTRIANDEANIVLLGETNRCNNIVT